jgi:predicted DNA-binding transcriptional regulator YafY
MANTGARTLRLLSLLQTHRYWPGTELADRLGVSARTLRRDVDRLRELGYPVKANRGVDGGYQLAAGTALPPLVIDDEEAVALVVGLRAAALDAVEGMAESSLRALAKVMRVMPARLRRRVEALHEVTVPARWGDGEGPGVDPSVLTTVALACRGEERLLFGYRAADGSRTERHAEPHRLVPLGRRWYLVAYDLDRADWRSFRVDRLSSPEATGERFRPRELPAADAAAFVRARLENLPRPHRVEALVDAPAGAVRHRIGRWCRVEELGPARSRVELTTDDLNWAVTALGMAGADFQVVGPAELVERTREWGERLSRAARAGAGTRPGTGSPPA